MQLFGNTIRRQLTLVVLCTSLVGLGIVYATFEFYVRASFRRTLTGELSVLADSVAANSHVPLAFHDEKWAEDVLGELGAERRVVAACLYSSDGKILAVWRAFYAPDNPNVAGGPGAFDTFAALLHGDHFGPTVRVSPQSSKYPTRTTIGPMLATTCG